MDKTNKYTCEDTDDEISTLTGSLYLMKEWNDGERGFIIKFHDLQMLAKAKNCFSYSPMPDFDQEVLLFEYEPSAEINIE